MDDPSAKEQLKEKLRQSPTFRAEIKDKIKGALLAKVPSSTPIQYAFDSYMLQDIQPGEIRYHAVSW